MAKRSWIGIAAFAGLVGTAAVAQPWGAPDRPMKTVGREGCAGYKWQAQLPPRAATFGCRGNVMHFELQPGDVAPVDIMHNHPAERAEIAEATKHAPTGEFWFSFAMRIEPGPPVTSKWIELGQLRAQQDKGAEAKQSPFAQGLDAGDRFRVIVRSSATNTGQPLDKGLVLYRQPDFPRGQFHTFVYRINYTPTAAGALDMWMDGQQKIAYRGPIGYNDQQGPYLKFGIYREPSQDRLAVDYANIEVGGPELRDRITTPLPIDDRR